MGTKIGIIAAMDIELQLLRQDLEGEESQVITGKTYYTGSLCGQSVVMAVCGVGKVNAAVCAQTMILKFAPELLINTGVAGGLAAGIGVGGVVVASDAVQHDMDTTVIGSPHGALDVCGKYTVNLPCDKNTAQALLEQAKKLGAAAVLGTVASGDQFIHCPQRNEFLRGTFNAACCEMEGGAIAHVCAMSGTRCAIVRVMSDSADNDAPVNFLEFAPKAADLSAKIVRGFLGAL
ncbi:MAG: 5'-methylthioadenosine/adenosylhomocysteine nucleosidase [Oscillospiraceae bacterium]|nr:5'-methylthioadenosine/adenosylhomocysteine nucleosidase [Oscillospiraceae bacterium]